MGSESSARPDPDVIGTSGREIYGATRPGAAVPCSRKSPLTSEERREVVELVAVAHETRTPIELPERLRTRNWDSIMRTVLDLDARRGKHPAGWKIGAASEAIRRAEGLPSPAPGRLYSDGIFTSPAVLPSDLFVNYRNNECEFAFRIGEDLPPRAVPYTEQEVSAAVESLVLAIEIGDSVFVDWYGASAYLGSSLDNGGGAALVLSEPIVDWRGKDLANSRMDLYLNGTWVKAGYGRAAMGDPITSLTWLVNWLSERGLTLAAGEVVSTGTCTGHCFAASGDRVDVDFHEWGAIEVHYL